MYAQDFVVLLLAHDLHETRGLVDDARLRVRRERELPHRHVVAALPGRGLRQSDGGDLGSAIRAARDLVVVQGTRLALRHVLDGHDAFRRRDVCEPGSGNDVADRVHVRNVRLHPPVDPDVTAVGRDAERLEADPFRKGLPAHGQQDLFRPERLGLAAGRPRDDFDPRVAPVHALDAGVHVDRDPLPLERRGELPGNFLVLERNDAREDLDHRRLGSEAGKHGGELDPDRPRADHEKGLRDLRELEDRVRGEHPFVVDLDARKGPRRRTRRDQDVLRGVGRFGRPGRRPTPFRDR